MEGINFCFQSLDNCTIWLLTYSIFHIIMETWFKGIQISWWECQENFGTMFEHHHIATITIMLKKKKPFYCTDYGNYCSWQFLILQYYSVIYFPSSAYYHLYSIYPNINLTENEPCSKPSHLLKITVDLETSSVLLEGTLYCNSMRIWCFSIERLRGK